MVLSVNAGEGIFSALRNLTSSTTSLYKTNDEISSGYKVGNARDDAATFSIAQQLRGGGLASVSHVHGLHHEPGDERVEIETVLRDDADHVTAEGDMVAGEWLMEKHLL